MAEQKDGHRHESEETGGALSPERINRNWGELLQELRVAQTGVQILTGFLLTVPFSTRFGDLDGFQKNVYLTVLVGSVLTTVMIVAPAAHHRALFRQRQREWLVETANRFAQGGLAMLALVSSGVVLLVFDVVVGRTPALIASVGVLVAFAVAWMVVPLLQRTTD